MTPVETRSDHQESGVSHGALLQWGLCRPGCQRKVPLPSWFALCYIHPCTFQRKSFFSDAPHTVSQKIRVNADTAYLFFFKNDPVEKELKVLICIIYAKLFKAVEGEILQSTKKWDSVECNPNFTAIKSISKIFYCRGKTSYSDLPQIHRYQEWRWIVLRSEDKPAYLFCLLASWTEGNTGSWQLHLCYVREEK